MPSLLLWQRLWQRGTAELAEKPRLRLGVWALGGIVLVYGLLAQTARLTEAHREYARQTEGLARVAGAVSREDWPQLREAERRNQENLQAMLWQADTPGQAQAQMQQALRSMIDEVDLREPRIRPGVTQPVPELPSVARVQVELVGRYRGTAALEFLEAVATSPARLVVDRMVLRRESGHMEALLSAYFVGVDIGAEDAAES